MAQVTKNLTYVVVSALNRMKKSMDDYDWLEQIAIEWFTELGRATDVPAVKVAHFNVGNGSRRWAMPADFIRHSKIGCKRNGYFYTLTRRDDLIVDESPCEIGESPTGETGGFTFGAHWWGGVYYSPIFTIGGGKNIAYYKINNTDRTIDFSTDVNRLPNSEVLIEYLSSGEASGDTMINPAYIEPMRNYLIWQLCEFDPTLYGMAKDRERIYHETLYNAKGAMCPTIDEVLDAVWSGTKFNLF